MNAFEQKLSIALRDEAGEIAMSTDINEGRQALDHTLDRVDRHRRRQWFWATAAAVATVVALVVGFVIGTRPATNEPPPAISTTPTPSPSATVPFRVETSSMSPNLTVDLPYWAALSGAGGQGVGYANYDQADCGTAPCPPGQERKIKILSVTAMYRLQDGPRVTQNPSYAVDLAAWEAIPSLGYGTVTDRRTTTVGGRPAVLLTVTATKNMPGLASCQSPYDAPQDCFYPQKDRTYRVAVVDQGKGNAPTLLWESMNADSPNKSAVLAEFDTWLATVRFA